MDSASGAALPKKKPASHFEIVGVTVVNVYAKDPATALKQNMTLLIEGNRIAAVRPTSEEELKALLSTKDRSDDGSSKRMIDGRGHYAVPGLIDTHVHIDWDRDEAGMLKLFLAQGVTTVLDTGNSPQRIFPLRKKIARGAWVGPSIEACGAAMTASPAAWPGMTVVSTPNQIRQAIRQRAAAGARFVKVYAQLPPELTHPLIQAAHQRGLRVIGHLGRTNAQDAAIQEINIITHLSGIPDAAVPDPEVPRAQHAKGFSQGWQATNAAWQTARPEALQRLIQQMLAGRIALAPTLYFQKVFATLGQSTVEKKEAVQFSHAPKSILKGWERFTMEVGDFNIYRNAWPAQKHFVKAFYDAGGLLIAGTDTPNQYVPPGFSLHQEIETFVEAGIPPLAALKAATVNASRALGLEDELGSIEVGNRADVLLIDANPLENIKHVRRIQMIFHAGQVYHPNELLAALPE